MFKSGLDWYRGVIIKQKADQVTLFSVDWGWISEVSPDNIQPLEEELRRVKFWGSACSLMEGEEEEGIMREGDKLKMTVVKIDGVKYIVKKN